MNQKFDSHSCIAPVNQNLNLTEQSISDKTYDNHQQLQQKNSSITNDFSLTKLMIDRRE